MFTERKLLSPFAVVATLALYAFSAPCLAARGGGGHGGGGHAGGHGGEHRGGENHGGEHNHHPYHPSNHHVEHHDDHNHVAHYNHHHEDWHHGDWGHGYWGDAGLAYGGWGYGGGNTIVDNNNVTPVSNESSSDEGDDDNDNTASNDGSSRDFPTDNWPELGLVTYAGEYGASQGQVVMSVIPGSAAEKAGLVAGDVILTFNGQPVPSADDLDTAIDTAKGKFEVSVWDARTGRKSTLSGALDPAAATPATKSTAYAPAQ